MRDLIAHFKGYSDKRVPATTVHDPAHRLSEVLKRNLQAKDLDVRAGFSRFKMANRRHSIQVATGAGMR